MNAPSHRPRVACAVFYQDPSAALAWRERAFGFERAKSVGAEILQTPKDEFYGDRTYRARDPEGHVWTFGQTVNDVSREEAEQASGLTTEGWR